ncbi:NUDIX hydrolase [bacterium]|nr:NUDIX hydrolase [bacterium]
MKEETVTSKKVYEGRIIDVRYDDVRLASGNMAWREVVEHSGGVTICAVKDDKILFVKQYRYPLKQDLLELPAGKLEKDENPHEACKRELEEETGYKANKWTFLGNVYSSAGFCDEKLYLYLAQDLEFVGKHPDEDELLENMEYSISDVKKMIMNGEITDAKTICAIYKSLNLIGESV